VSIGIVTEIDTKSLGEFPEEHEALLGGLFFTVSQIFHGAPPFSG
jgi:hypothetical protein